MLVPKLYTATSAQIPSHRVRTALNRLRSSGNLRWSIAALFVCLIVTAPLGAILKRHAVEFRCEPRAWFRLRVYQSNGLRCQVCVENVSVG